MLNWMTEITDLLRLFVVSVTFESDYASREVVGRGRVEDTRLVAKAKDTK